MRILSFNAGQGGQGRGAWPVKWLTLLLWALAAGVVVFWCLRWSSGGAGPLPAPAPEPALQVDAPAMAKALGAVALPAAAPAAAPASSRYALLGVLAGRDSGAGSAVIVVGGKPARSFRVGDTVEDGVVLQSLAAREARLGSSMQGPATAVLELKKPLQ
jgi:general secretion pathway protein C